MTHFNLAPDMGAERAAAKAKVDAHFNQLALASLHDDLVQLALERPSSILKREQQRQELFATIDAATTPAEIQQALSTL